MSIDQERLLARLEELERRLAQLETKPTPRGQTTLGTHAPAALLVGLMLAALTAPAWVLAQGDRPTYPEIACRKLTVVDANGRPRVVIAFNDAGGSVKVLNAAGQSTAVLENDPVGGLIRLIGNNEKRLFEIGGSKNGCQLNLCDPDGNIRAYLGCDAAREGHLTLRNSQNKTTLQCGTDGDGGLVRAASHDGKDRAFFGVGAKQGDGLIMLFGADGNRRHVIGSDDDAAYHHIYAKDGVLQHQILGGKAGAYHSLWSKDGANVIASIGASNDTGEGIVRLNTTKGKNQAYIGANSNGTGGLILLNTPEDSSRVQIGIDSAKEGFITLLNVNNKPALRCGNSEDGGFVSTSAKDGTDRAFFGAAKQGDGVMVLFGADGKRRHWIGSDDDIAGHYIYAKEGILQHQLRAGKTGAFHAMMSKDGAHIIANIGASGDTGEGIVRLNTTTGKTQAYIGANTNGTGGLLLLNTPMDSSRVLIGIDNNGVGYGQARDGENVIRREWK